ncbi:MAG: response regulator transcription factor [Rhodoferax sp.]|nr:response regulator transcription factor [Rhodoferax sp.]MBP9927945.1 response regulator transcription factor [Rhodoferax sp.]HQX58379.1 response regulator [Burkholderiaceae bacterium]HQZ05329.1 response regulator [Burkholderiaceae bacterium]HRA64006.1 response regulator [Burkholderiaceae bacterium]
MQPTPDVLVFIVDDDASVRSGLAWLLRSRGLPSQAFDSAVAFDALLQSGLRQTQACCLLLDVRMPVMSGLALFERMIERDLCQTIPVIFLTGHADLPTAVDAVKRGAFDFCEKPVSDNALVDRVEQALARSAQVLQVQIQRELVGRMLAGLTERELAVMRLMLDGLPNKLIADQLQISVRTVEVHRARVFDKMRVKSAVELANALQHR